MKYLNQVKGYDSLDHLADEIISGGMVPTLNFIDALSDNFHTKMFMSRLNGESKLASLWGFASDNLHNIYLELIEVYEHETNVSFEELAPKVGNLSFDSLSNFLGYLSEGIINQKKIMNNHTEEHDLVIKYLANAKKSMDLAEKLSNIYH